MTDHHGWGTEGAGVKHLDSVSASKSTNLLVDAAHVLLAHPPIQVVFPHTSDEHHHCAYNRHAQYSPFIFQPPAFAPYSAHIRQGSLLTSVVALLVCANEHFPLSS